MPAARELLMKSAMALTIGKKPGRPGLEGQLLDCHGRIRELNDLALRLGEAVAPRDQEVADAATRVRRYFAEALPLHVRDEEDSILPRLRGRDPRVDEALERMHREHEEHDPQLARLLAAATALAQSPAQHGQLAPALREAAAELAGAFLPHLRSEEEVIFPALAQLPPELQETILAEVRARRAR
jgi:iron-sulfur cluster repair protein YtfE (RIC family)